MKFANILISNIIILLAAMGIGVVAHAETPKSSHQKFFLSGYWQNFSNPAETPVRLTDIPDGYQTVNVAFADLASDGSVSFTLQGPPYDGMQNGEATFKNDIQTLQSRGVKIILSLGGQNGYFSINTQAEENNFVSTLNQVLVNYGFDGVDYDFESGLSTANISYLVDATQKLKQTFQGQGKQLSFSLAPETIDVYWQVFPYGKYDELIKSGLVDTVQVQLYNSGCMSGKNGDGCYSQGSEDFIVSQADSTIQTWMQNGITQADRKYVIGLPATVNAAGGGYADPAVIKKALSCLQTQTQCDHYIPVQTYADLGGFMTWSINWDAKNGYAFEKSIAENAIK